MKKYLILLTAIILALVLVACNDTDKPEETSAQDEVTTAADETSENTTTADEVTTAEETTVEETTVEETTAPDVDLSADELKLAIASAFAKTDALTAGKITMNTSMSTSYENEGETVTESDDSKVIFTINGTNVSVITEPLSTNYTLIGNKLYVAIADFWSESTTKLVVELTPEQMMEFAANYIISEKPTFDIDAESLASMASMFAGKKHADGSISVYVPALTNELLSAILGAQGGDIPTEMLQINTDTFKFTAEIDKDGYMTLVELNLDAAISLFGSSMNMGMKMSMAIDTDANVTVTEPADKDEYTTVTYDELIDQLGGGGWDIEFPTEQAEELGLGLDKESYNLSIDYDIFSEQAGILAFYGEYYEGKTFTLVGECQPCEYMGVSAYDIVVSKDDEDGLSMSNITVLAGPGIELPEGQTVCVQGVMTKIQSEELFDFYAIVVNYIVPSN